MDNPETFSSLPRRRRRVDIRRVGIGVVIAVTFFLISIFRNVSIFYTDFLWFDSVDLTSVWSGLLFTKVGLAAASVAFFFAVLWVNLWVVDHTAPRSLTFNQEDELARRYQAFARPRAGWLRFGIAFVLALFAGIGFSDKWQEWLLFRNGGNFGTKDPQFNTDIGFYVFKLPFLTSILNWMFYAIVLAIIASLVAHYLQGAIRPQATSNRITSSVKVQISVLLGLLALVRAGHYYLERYRLDFSERGPTTGANYTDVHFLAPALLLLIGISILAAVMFFAATTRKGWSLPVITVALWAVVSILVGVVVPAGVQKFSVEPAESQKEAPYIKRNIDATRAAINLDQIKVNDFHYDPDLTAEELKANAQTIRNVRLWDPSYLQSVYQRLQENRSFFKFYDVDVDRYKIGNEATQVELAVRELNPSQLPSDRRSWVNEHLQYTHGFGVVASPANAVTSNGNPDFVLKDVPPQGAPKIDVPQVYFGEHSSPYSIVNTNQTEVDYVSVTGRDESSKYHGSGGVELSSLLRRAAFAARVANINPLISSLITDESKAMYYTNVRERVGRVAPFLRFDVDPYPVISEGRILWMQDAYTISNAYPYGQMANTSQVEGASGGLKGTTFNYVRNSVKITIDAYDGTMKFYVVDKSDPIARAWQKTFPKLFVDGAAMPRSVREHVRYPEDLFRIQSVMYGEYHIENGSDFYAKTDRWNIAQKPKFGLPTVTTTVAPPANAGAALQPVVTGEDRIEPFYLLMRLPGEQKESFLMFRPFVPYSRQDERKELSAFMVAKSDPDEYGQMQVYVMPRGQQIDGPALVEARIQQDPDIKQYITLLNQSESKVQLGNMLIIPIENSLLYVRPLYITSTQTQVPEFKKAIVVQDNHIKMADTLQEALKAIYGSAPETQEQGRVPTASNGAANGAATPVGPGATSTSTTTLAGGTKQATIEQVNALLDQANDEFARADQALRNGDLAAFQDHFRKGEALVKQARNG